MAGARAGREAGAAGPKDRRREEILEAAYSVLAELGYRGAGTREIAARAGASKETLYGWFGDKRGLFGELIRKQAAGLEAALSSSLGQGTDDDPSAVLRAFALGLQRLLLGERAVVINRVAISEAGSDPDFARILGEGGRGAVVPKLARYLEGQRARGRLEFGDAEAAVEVLIGLAIGDRQVRRLLGALPEPGSAEIEARADRAVEDFLALFGPRACARGKPERPGSRSP